MKLFIKHVQQVKTNNAMITIATHSTINMCKVIDKEGNSAPSADGKTFNFTIHDPKTPSELHQLFSALTSKQAIINGVPDFNTLTERIQLHFSIDNPWFKFDGDYLINNKPLTRELLIKADPQLAKAMMLEVNSSSNILVDNVAVKPHKKGFWVQFDSQSMGDIAEYASTMHNRIALIMGGFQLLADSETSWQTYFRTGIDEAVFNANQRLCFEAKPLIEAENIKHNTYHHIYNEQGSMVRTDGINGLTYGESQRLNIITSEAKALVVDAVAERKAYAKENYPERYRLQVEAESRGYLTAPLIRNDYSVMGNPSRALHPTTTSELRDPIDPDYGAGKARTFLNENGTMYLHSFAHGSAQYRLVFPAMELLEIPEVLVQLSVLEQKGRTAEMLSAKSRALSLIKDYIRELAPRMVYTTQDITLLEDALGIKAKVLLVYLKKGVMEKTDVLLSDDARQRWDAMHEELSRKYSVLTTGSTPFVYLDVKKKTIERLSYDKPNKENFIEANNLRGLHGEIMDDTKEGRDRVQDIINDMDRISGFGMYEPDKVPHGMANLWEGFDVVPFDRDVTEEEIKPFLYLLTLATDRDYHSSVAGRPSFTDLSFPQKETPTTKWVLDWMADAIQDPMRAGMHPTIEICGYHRTGKSTLSDCMQSFYKSLNTGVIDNYDRLFGRFNSWLSMVAFIAIEEAPFKRGEDAAFKNFIAAKYIQTEIKNVDGALSIPGVHRVMSTTNQAPRFQAETDRRTTTLIMGTKHANDIKFFSAFLSWWEAKGKELTFTYLYRRSYKLSHILESLNNKDTISGKLNKIPSPRLFAIQMVVDAKEALVNIGSSTELNGQYNIEFAESEDYKFFKSAHGNKITKAMANTFLDMTDDALNGMYKNNNEWYLDIALCKANYSRLFDTEWDVVVEALQELDLLQELEAEDAQTEPNLD